MFFMVVVTWRSGKEFGESDDSDDVDCDDDGGEDKGGLEVRREAGGGVEFIGVDGIGDEHDDYDDRSNSG